MEKGQQSLSILTFILVSVIKSALTLFVLLTAVAYTVWLERKVVGHMQNRWGPTRVGPFGLLQPAADGIKFLFKEDLTPPHVYKPLYIAAPVLAVVFALTSISVIPIGNWITLAGVHTPLQITDVNIGLLMILGVTSMGVYGVALAGWSSNNKYSLLGGLRASAQMVSYEISLGLSLVGVLIMSGSLSLRAIVDAQGGRFWGRCSRSCFRCFGLWRKSLCSSSSIYGYEGLCPASVTTNSWRSDGSSCCPWQLPMWWRRLWQWLGKEGRFSALGFHFSVAAG